MKTLLPLAAATLLALLTPSAVAEEPQGDPWPADAAVPPVLPCLKAEHGYFEPATEDYVLGVGFTPSAYCEGPYTEVKDVEVLCYQPADQCTVINYVFDVVVLTNELVKALV
ncbi:MAG: hypothetical protein WC876_07150 [Candidatus Thermoplasmatota archaeon]|jgi:hypothetical protein